MSTEVLWRVVEDQRNRIAAFLESLAEKEWTQPSLCDGWTVKDVAAHLAVVPHAPSLRQMLPMVLRARGSLDQVNHDIACRYALERSTDQLVAELRENASTRDLPKVTSVQNLAMDIVVHGQDMALALNRELPVPADASLNALQRVWSMGWPFHARRKLAGYRFSATDADWTTGDGPGITGTTIALLLLATGRVTAARPLLDGPGVLLLASSAPPSSR